MKLRKSFICILLLCIMSMAATLLFTACKDGESSSEGLKYVLSNDGSYYIVADLGTCTDRNVEIASVYNDLPVKEICNNAFADTDIKSVIIPDSITKIGDSAFADCERLRTVTMGSGVTSIGFRAFSHCELLKNVTLPESLISVGESAFSYCSRLKTVTLGNNVVSIGDRAFAQCTRLTSVTIGRSVRYIGNHVVNGCTKLKSVKFETTNGWICNDVFVSANDLSDPAVAAHYLMRPYTSAWSRK